MMKYFQPISLIGCIHKLVACVLIARLRMGMNFLVSFTQTAFIQGRNIYDGWILVAEVVDLIKRNKSGIIFKLDFEKAYDWVN